MGNIRQMKYTFKKLLCCSMTKVKNHTSKALCIPLDTVSVFASDELVGFRNVPVILTDKTEKQWR